MDFHGDHTSMCTAHSGANKAHDWMVRVLGPLAPSVESRPARANGAATWRFATTYETKLVHHSRYEPNACNNAQCLAHGPGRLKPSFREAWW